MLNFRARRDIIQPRKNCCRYGRDFCCSWYHQINYVFQAASDVVEVTKASPDIPNAPLPHTTRRKHRANNALLIRATPATIRSSKTRYWSKFESTIKQNRTSPTACRPCVVNCSGRYASACIYNSTHLSWVRLFLRVPVLSNRPPPLTPPLPPARPPPSPSPRTAAPAV